MTTEKEELEVDEDFAPVEAEAEVDEVEVEPAAGTSKSNLSKRRTIDNLLEERRLQKQLADFDFDL